MDRPFFDSSIDELEKLVRDRPYDVAVLGRVREELTYRDTERAKRLLREVEGLVKGEVPMPERPLRPSSPDDQIDMLGTD